MSELTKIHEQNGSNTISAREVHSFLEVNEKFSDWIKRMFEHGLSRSKIDTVLNGIAFNKDLIKIL